MTHHRRFLLCSRDEKGTTPGQDALAEGIIFSNNKVALAWLTREQSISVHDNLNSLQRALCQDGKTELVWVDHN